MVFCRVGRFDPFDMDLMTGLALFVCARGQKSLASGNYTRSAEATSGLRRTIALEWMAEAIFHAYRDEDGGGELSGLRVQPTPGSIALQFVVARGDSREVMDSKKDVKKKLYWGPRFRLCVPECGVFNDSASCAVTVTRCYRAPDELKGWTICQSIVRKQTAENTKALSWNVHTPLWVVLRRQARAWRLRRLGLLPLPFTAIVSSLPAQRWFPSLYCSVP
ncbi:hypothetical protein EDB86DRAFT_2379551 [Lactarius hatsudake]|nr:hypothetical protein EDB86DRAFT_2379551 [Lactarius hatsudake]